MLDRRVLLVHRDVDALRELATQLRRRGVRVSLANGTQMACERAKSGGYDAILVAREAAEPTDDSMGAVDALSFEISGLPPLLVFDDVASAASPLSMDDIDGIMERLASLDATTSATRGSLSPTQFSLENAPLLDLLTLLSAEQRSGSIRVTTARGSGEVRLLEGELLDVVYVRAEGAKALARLVGESAGLSTFTPGAPSVMRRLRGPTRELLSAAAASCERAATLRRGAQELSNATLATVDDESAAPETSTVHALVVDRLRAPASLDALLDDVAHDDALVLEALVDLLRRGRVRKVGAEGSSTQLCTPEQLHVVRATAARARAAGFAGPARVVFAGTPGRLGVFAHSVLGVADAVPSGEAAPPAPIPYPIATLRLGDGVEIEVVALPLVPTYAPLWGLSVAGAAVVVRLDGGAAEALEEACEMAGVRVKPLDSASGAITETSPSRAAALIRAALELDG